MPLVTYPARGMKVAPGDRPTSSANRNHFVNALLKYQWYPRENINVLELSQVNSRLGRVLF